MVLVNVIPLYTFRINSLIITSLLGLVTNGVMNGGIDSPWSYERDF